MHIADMLALRSIPAAGVFLMLTRRCPLTCAHCSTNSTVDGEEHSAEIFQGFARSFTQTEHPQLIWLTGGEPLLRPDLVREIVRSAHAVGARVAMTSGLYFARGDGRIPTRIREAMLAVDHVVASQDVFHEVQVPRVAAFATVAALLDAGQDVSFQVVGQGPNDPYLSNVTTDIRHTFGDRVPALVAMLRSAGRAGAWFTATAAHRDEQAVALPRSIAAWPVVTFDGTIVAYGQRQAVDMPATPHLRLGVAPGTGWPEVARTLRERSTLAGDSRVTIPVGAIPRGSTFSSATSESRLADMPAGSEGFARAYGIPAYAHMINLGRTPSSAPVLSGA